MLNLFLNEKCNKNVFPLIKVQSYVEQRNSFDLKNKLQTCFILPALSALQKGFLQSF